MAAAGFCVFAAEICAADARLARHLTFLLFVEAATNKDNPALRHSQNISMICFVQVFIN
jgi:hypothetical protein